MNPLKLYERIFLSFRLPSDRVFFILPAIDASQSSDGLGSSPALTRFEVSNVKDTSWFLRTHRRVFQSSLLFAEVRR